jgi:gluconate kinase
MSKRKDHFMPETLLKSQFDTLEIPQDAVRINIENSPEVITEIIIEKIKEIK